MDSTSGQLEPASGARASIPGEEYWPEGTASRVRAARAPEPTGTSAGSPSYGKSPGSRRRKYKTSAAAESSQVSIGPSDSKVSEIVDDIMEDPTDSSSEYVIYQPEYEENEEAGSELDKKLGRPHPFIDPKVKKPMEEPLTSEELWWNWRKPEKEQWSRWQRRRSDVEIVSAILLTVLKKLYSLKFIVFLKAMAETGQVKLYGEHPTLTVQSKASSFQGRKRDSQCEAIQKHFEETGEDENTQLIEMFCHQTDREYRIMMGTDVRIQRDPLAMRMREDQIKQIWGGDPVYPTVNYIQDPDEVIDYRGPDFHEPTPNMLAYVKEQGKIISREELEKILAKEKTEEQEMTDIDDATARAVDIGENEDDDEEDYSEVSGEEEEEKITRNWSVLKTTPQLRKSKAKPKKEDPMSLEEAVDDSENLTDFLMDFEEDE
ncbi:hypothetical protein DITRI_Ditri19aG0070300 [Diplodiscus trichospermus]